MKTYRLSSLILVAVLSGAIVLTWTEFSDGMEKNVEIRPNLIRNPEPRTETTRLIDAYERLLERTMRLMEQNTAGLNPQIRGISTQLSCLERKIDNLGDRLAAIEKRLNPDSSQIITPAELKKNQVPPR